MGNVPPSNGDNDNNTTNPMDQLVSNMMASLNSNNGGDSDPMQEMMSNMMRSLNTNNEDDKDEKESNPMQEMMSTMMESLNVNNEDGKESNPMVEMMSAMMKSLNVNNAEENDKGTNPMQEIMSNMVGSLKPDNNNVEELSSNPMVKMLSTMMPSVNPNPSPKEPIVITNLATEYHKLPDTTKDTVENIRTRFKAMSIEQINEIMSTEEEFVNFFKDDIRTIRKDLHSEKSYIEFNTNNTDHSITFNGSWDVTIKFGFENYAVYIIIEIDSTPE